jgi:hypothetical protein
MTGIELAEHRGHVATARHLRILVAQTVALEPEAEDGWVGAWVEVAEAIASVKSMLGSRVRANLEGIARYSIAEAEQGLSNFTTAIDGAGAGRVPPFSTAIDGHRLPSSKISCMTRLQIAWWGHAT